MVLNRWEAIVWTNDHQVLWRIYGTPDFNEWIYRFMVGISITPPCILCRTINKLLFELLENLLVSDYKALLPPCPSSFVSETDKACCSRKLFTTVVKSLNHVLRMHSNYKRNSFWNCLVTLHGITCTDFHNDILTPVFPRCLVARNHGIDFAGYTCHSLSLVGG